MNIPEFKGAIFDIDGTLLDSLPVWNESDRIFLAEHGVEYDPMIAEKMKSLHFVTAAQFFIDEYHIDMPLEDVMRRISEIVGEQYLNSVPAKRAVPSLLRQLRERGVRMCAATSNKYELAEGALKRLGLWEYLDFLITCDEIGCGKENPDIYIYCAERLGLSPSDIMVFEDAVHGAECAKNAGFAVTGVFDEGAGEDFNRIAKFADHTVNFNGEEAVFH